jgi:hypothetical protein
LNANYGDLDVSLLMLAGLRIVPAALFLSMGRYRATKAAKLSAAVA